MSVSAFGIVVRHRDFRPLEQLRRLQQDAKQGPDLRAHFSPTGLTSGVLVELVTEVARHLRGLSLPNEEANFTRLLQELPIRQPGHRREERTPRIGRLGGNGHAPRLLPIVKPQRATIERLFVGEVKLESATPGFSLAHAIHDDVDSNILSLGLAVNSLDVPDMQVAPEEVGIRDWNGAGGLKSNLAGRMVSGMRPGSQPAGAPP